MKPKEMTIALMSPKRNQLLIDATVAAVYKFAVENAGLDKLVIEVVDSFELRKKDETILKLTEALEELSDLMDDVRTGDYEPDSFTTQPARQVLKEVRPEPVIIIDDEVPDIDLNNFLNIIKGDGDGKV